MNESVDGRDGASDGCMAGQPGLDELEELDIGYDTYAVSVLYVLVDVLFRCVLCVICPCVPF